MPRRFTKLFAFLLTSLPLQAAVGDVMHLRDGSSIEGDVKRRGDGWVVYLPDGKARNVSADAVESIDLTPATGPAAARQRLASLRQSVASSSDLREIIARVQRFVDADTDPASATDARKDLADWQAKLAQNRVKVGAAWVLPAERDALQRKSLDLAGRARQLMKQGRTKEAEPLLADALATDPQNASALYLQGLLRYQQEQLPAARRAFDLVASLVPNDASTLNDLAIVLWRQRQYVPALARYDEAMLSSPQDQLVLDNVASALAALPPEFARGPIVDRVTRHLGEQDQQLTQRMAASGLHRVGTLWVSDADLDRVRQQQRQTQAQLDDLSAQFDRAQQHERQLEQALNDTEQQMHRVEASSLTLDPLTGLAGQRSYPPVYAQLARDDQQLRGQRDAEVKRLDTIKRQAADLQRDMPGHREPGLQIMVGPEGTPVRVASATPPSR